MDETTDPLYLKLTAELVAAVMEWRARADLLRVRSDDEVVEVLYIMVGMAKEQAEARALTRPGRGDNVVSLADRRLLAKGFSMENGEDAETKKIDVLVGLSANSSVIDALLAHVGGDPNALGREIVRRGVASLESDALGSPAI